MGFFSSELRDSYSLLSTQCGKCKLDRGCITPKMQPTGAGRKGILIVAEAPGEKEDREGIQLIGKAGQLLRKYLGELDIKLDRDCWKTNAVNCRPKENRTPKPKEIEACRPSLIKLIKEKKPKVVILLGGSAVESLIGSLWKKKIDTIGRWLGWRIPCREYNTWICPNWHPSYLLRQNSPILNLWFKKYLEQALELSGYPYPGEISDLTKDVTIIREHDKAAKYIRRFISKEEPVAFDYETNRLKPDDINSAIVSCAISDGKHTIAFPWMGEAIGATSELLQSKVPKIGANIKFEERWTKRILKHGVRNWLWDCMVASHTLNNTPGITSVKFQSFVRFGISDYSSDISPFFETSNGNAENKIRQIELSKLLLYNGMDALMEYKIAQEQMKEMNYYG